MKKKILILALAVCVLVCAVACSEEDLWANATYKNDTAVGEGAKTVTVLITEGENSVTLTVKTDKDTLGDALFELGLVNDRSFFDTLNGVLASWEKEQAYWAFYVGDELSPVGIAETAVNGGEDFRFVYTK